LYRSTGAVVEVFDISPTYPSSEFYNVQNLAFEDWQAYVGDNPYDPNFIQQISDAYYIDVVGQHYFQNGVDGLTPVWDFRQVYGPNAIALGKVVGDLPSTDAGSVDWLHLTVSSGDLAQDILRVYTVGGDPPSQVSIPRSVMCSARLNVAFFSVRLDQETFRSNLPHSIVSAHPMPIWS
jgi:hypothetical protein